MPEELKLRLAQISDIDAIRVLIRSSARVLGSTDYSSEQIEGALETAWGLDSQLIEDQTYFVVEAGMTLVACGGYSFRETLFGNNAEQNRNPERIDPTTGAAKIRAFFIHPDFARRGIGSLIMRQCESEVHRLGYNQLELMATHPGLRLYEKHGFVAGTPVDYPLPNGLSIEFIPMSKKS